MLKPPPPPALTRTKGFSPCVALDTYTKCEEEERGEGLLLRTAAAVENNNGRPAHNADSKTQRDCRLALLHILRVCVRNKDRERGKIA